MKITRRVARRQAPKAPRKGSTLTPSPESDALNRKVRGETVITAMMTAETEIIPGDGLIMTWHSGRDGSYPVISRRAKRERHDPKAVLADDVLRQLFPPDGKPSRTDVPDFEQKVAVYDELKRRRTSLEISETTILRRAGRRK